MNPGAQASNALLVLTRDSELERAVRAAAEGDARHACRVLGGKTLQDLVAALESESPPVVAVVDVDPQPLSFLQSLEPIIRRFGDTRFVVLVEAYANEVVLEAMQVGVRHCMLKSAVPGELAGVLHRMLVDAGAAPAPDGALVSVMTASGGCGGTTLAINLADEFRRSSKRPVMLVDMDLDYGGLGSYLGLRADGGLADVLASDRPLTAQRLAAAAAVYLDDLHVLSSPASVDFANPAPIEDFRQLRALLEACRLAYPHTVVDAPRQSRQHAATLAAHSDLTLIVFELSVTDVRGARALMRALTERGVAQEKLLPVANRITTRGRHELLSLDDAREALGGVGVHSIANDYEGAIRSVNYGRPIEAVAPRSPMRKDLTQLAELALTRRGDA